MSGVLAAWIAATGVGAAAGHQAVAVDAAAELERLTRPHLDARPGDTPAALACRRELAERVEDVKRAVGRKLDSRGYYNLLEALCHTGRLRDGLAGPSWDVLACYRAAMRCCRAVIDQHAPLGRVADPPGTLGQGRAQLMHLESCIKQAITRCVRPAAWSIR